MWSLLVCESSAWKHGSRTEGFFKCLRMKAHQSIGRLLASAYLEFPRIDFNLSKYVYRVYPSRSRDDDGIYQPYAVDRCFYPQMLS